jgi:hypothetical protein
VTWVDYLTELQEAIQRLHRVRATYLETIPVNDEAEGQPTGASDVEVFELHGHSSAERAYAWITKREPPNEPTLVIVLQAGSITSAALAVKAATAKRVDGGERTTESQYL